MLKLLGPSGRVALGTTLAGLVVGTAEAFYQQAPLLYAALLYAAGWAVAGCVAGLVASLAVGRWRERIPWTACGYSGALKVSTLLLVHFIVWRDRYAEAPDKQLTAWLWGLGAAAAVGALTFVPGYLIERRRPTRHPFGGWAVAVAALIGFGGLAASAPDDTMPYEKHDAPTQRHARGVILVVADALRADALGSYGAGPLHGEPATPNLDAFAQKSLRFENATAQASWTKPTMASILTSRYVSSHGTMGKAAMLPSELPTMASELQIIDVSTAAVVTNYNLTRGFGFAHGFDEYNYIPPARYLGAPPEANRLAAYNTYRLLRERYCKAGREARYFYRPAKVVNDIAFDLIDRIGSGKFFLWLHYMEAHDPYFDRAGHTWAKVSDPHPQPSDAAALHEAYRDGVQRFDTAFGALMAGLEARGLTDDLMVIVVADHGEEFGEHAGFYHGTSLYEELLHVPLLVRGPGVPPGVTKQLARQIDIAPTILGYFAQPPPTAWEGVSLLAPQTAPTTAMAEENHEGNVLASLRRVDANRTLKLITANADNPRGLPPVALYDLTVDSVEANNLAPADGRIAELEALLTAQQQKSRQDSPEASNQKLDPAAQAELRSLGYVQ